MNQEFIAKMKVACRLAADTLTEIEAHILPGTTTKDLDKIANDFILGHGGTPANVGYKGFPSTICTSVNDVVCHGVPDDRLLEEGDILKVDVAVIVDGHYGDTCRTWVVYSPLSSVSGDKARLVTEAHEVMMKGISILRPGVTVGDIGFTVNKAATRKGYGVVVGVGGHGIGTGYHLAPHMVYQGKKGRGTVLEAGQCITVEPMINLGSGEVIEEAIPNSEITIIKTKDKSLSAQFEHTVLITETGYEILTLP